MWPAHFTDAITDALESGFVRSGLHSIQMTLHMLWKVVFVWSAQYTDAIANALVGGLHVACTVYRCCCRCSARRLWAARYTEAITDALESGFVWPAQYTDTITDALATKPTRHSIVPFLSPHSWIRKL